MKSNIREGWREGKMGTVLEVRFALWGWLSQGSSHPSSWIVHLPPLFQLQPLCLEPTFFPTQKIKVAQKKTQKSVPEHCDNIFVYIFGLLKKNGWFLVNEMQTKLRLQFSFSQPDWEHIPKGAQLHECGMPSVILLMLHWGNHISLSFHSEWDMIVVTVFSFEFWTK